MAFLNFFFWLKETELLHKKSHYGPIFLLDYYFPVLEETNSPVNGFLSTQIKNSGWTPLSVRFVPEKWKILKNLFFHQYKRKIVILCSSLEKVFD